MRTITLVILCVLFITNVKAQSLYTVTPDDQHNGGLIYNGIISKYALQNNDAFTWYQSAQSSYEPDSILLRALDSSKNTVRFIIFGGTWCEDTQFILPKFFKAQELSNFPDNRISLIVVDRNKQVIGNLAGSLNVLNVPTIIVMKDGKEVGRVVEYGKSGKWDADLAALLL